MLPNAFYYSNLLPKKNKKPTTLIKYIIIVIILGGSMLKCLGTDLIKENRLILTDNFYFLLHFYHHSGTLI